MVSEAGLEQGVIVLPLPIRSYRDVVGALGLGSRGKVGYTIGRPRVLHGRAPARERVDEVLVNPRFARMHEVGPGDHFDAVIVSGDDFDAIDKAGFSIPQGIAAVDRGEYGSRVRLKVAGVGVTPEEIVLDEGFEQPELFATPAFLRRYPQADAGFFGVVVRLRHGAADIPAFKKEVQALPHTGAIEFQTTTATEAKVARAVRPQVGALTIFAVVIALTGLLLVGQALARQTFLDSVDHPTLRALGFGRRELIVTSMLRAGAVAVAAAGLAMVVAVAASPLTPIGAARTAEPDLGVFLDGPVLVLGGGSRWWSRCSCSRRSLRGGTRGPRGSDRPTSPRRARRV